MGFSYLNGKCWWEVTRDERYFCAHLFRLAEQRGVSDFIAFLNQYSKAGLDLSTNWELGYEVCFYRDLWKLQSESDTNLGALYSAKRTFDLCLFSERTIVVIEAKAHQNFEPLQLMSFRLDEAEIKKATKVDSVVLIGLASSVAPLESHTQICFGNRCVTWKQLAEHYGNDKVLARADTIYEPSPFGTYGKNNSGGYMRGFELQEAFRAGEGFLVGREGGLRGPRLTEDIKSGAWYSRRYETNRVMDAAPNDNWFQLREFAARVAEFAVGGSR